MLIDWFTAVAQIANFLILVWLMKRYLYRPILNAIDAREKRIADQLKDAETRKTEAVKARDDFKQKNQAFDASRDKMMKSAQESADAERQKLLGEARKDSDVLRAKLDASLQDERATLNSKVVARIQEEVFAIARKALVNLANTDIESQMVMTLINRIGTLGQHEKDELASTMQTGAVPVLVRSAFALQAAQQEAIRQAMGTSFHVEGALKFEVSPNLVCGIELGMNGRKLAWSVDDYLSSLASRMNSLLESAAKKDGKTEPIADAKSEPVAPAVTTPAPGTPEIVVGLPT